MARLKEKKVSPNNPFTFFPGINASFVRYFRHKNVYPMLKELNRRRENIATDELLRKGKEKRPRRSEFTEW